jgi:hypothetical protein
MHCTPTLGSSFAHCGYLALGLQLRMCPCLAPGPAVLQHSPAAAAAAAAVAAGTSELRSG